MPKKAVNDHVLRCALCLKALLFKKQHARTLAPCKAHFDMRIDIVKVLVQSDMVAAHGFVFSGRFSKVEKETHPQRTRLHSLNCSLFSSKERRRNWIFGMSTGYFFLFNSLRASKDPGKNISMIELTRLVWENNGKSNCFDPQSPTPKTYAKTCSKSLLLQGYQKRQVVRNALHSQTSILKSYRNPKGEDPVPAIILQGLC